MFEFGDKLNVNNFLLIGFAAVVTLLTIHFVCRWIEE